MAGTGMGIPDADARSLTVQWQQSQPPPGLKVWTVEPCGADEHDDDDELPPGATHWGIFGPLEVLAVAGAMPVAVPVTIVRPSVALSSGLRREALSIPLPMSAAVLTCRGWLLLGAMAFTSLAEAQDHIETVVAMQGGEAFPGASDGQPEQGH